jgi:hypothetical protein
MQEAKQLLQEIERFCQRTGTAESTFGRQAINDGKLAGRLRAGKGVTLKTALRIRQYIERNSRTTSDDARAAVEVARSAEAGGDKPFRFYDNRQKYLAFVNTCNEKSAIARRAGKELQHIQPRPPALRVFDAGMGDATVLTDLLRDSHRRFPHIPVLVVAKEISLEDVRLGLEKLPDRFLEHPNLVVVITNLHYGEAPKLMPRNVHLAAALNWHEIRLEGTASYDYREQLESLDKLLVEGWQTRTSETSGNPVYVRPSVLVIYRQDHQFPLDDIIPRPGQQLGDFDLILASQPWRARMSAEFKAQKVLAPLVSELAPGGRLLAIQSYGDDPGLEIVQQIWPGEQPFKVRRHEIIQALKKELGRSARLFNFNAFSDAKSLFRYRMHTLPSEIGSHIGTSTLFAAWNAAIYVNQIEDERLQEAVATDRYLHTTDAVLKKHNGLWFNDETFVVSRHRR